MRRESKRIQRERSKKPQVHHVRCVLINSWMVSLLFSLEDMVAMFTKEHFTFVLLDHKSVLHFPTVHPHWSLGHE